jgi:subtilisin family serine protease
MQRLWFGLMMILTTCFVASSSQAVVVSVIDTGIDMTHPQLKNNLWVNSGEVGLDTKGRDKRSNKIDDDGNGFADDVHGWNFVSNSNDLTDRHGHGTHVAGLILGAQPGAISDAQTKLMVLKYYDPETSEIENLFNTVKAIEYAVKMKAQIINYSGGGYGKNSFEEAAISRAAKLGILFVAAAGNEKSNTDFVKYFPADYNLPNIISVAAIKNNGQLIPASNYGVKSVHVAALGDQVLSTTPGGWARMSGTSQAAANVTRSAALLLRQKMNQKIGHLPAQELIQLLIQSGSYEKNLAEKTKFKVRI